jgi:CRP/FNR family transcriptional regulator, cyclic AMP receptor protein
MAIDTGDLRAVPLLRPVDDRELKQLASSFTERRVPAGSPIVQEGQGGIAFFLVLDGVAEVSAAGASRELGPGSYFGEMSLLGADPPRSATVSAKTDVRLAGLSTWAFRPLLNDHPELALTMLETMATTLRDAEARIRELEA